MIGVDIKTGVSRLYQDIPDDVQDLVIQLGENISLDKWKIGDLTNFVKEQVKKNLLPVSIMDVYVFIAQLLRDEFAARTIEYFAGLAAFYPPEVREEYQPLSHSHFAYARQYGDHWLDVLNLALDLLAQNGKIPSVVYLDREYARRGQVLPDIPEQPPFHPEEVFQVASGAAGTVKSDYIAVMLSTPLKAAEKALETVVGLLKGFDKVEQAEVVQKLLNQLRESIDNLV